MRELVVVGLQRRPVEVVDDLDLLVVVLVAALVSAPEDERDDGDRDDDDAADDAPYDWADGGAAGRTAPGLLTAGPAG